MPKLEHTAIVKGFIASHVMPRAISTINFWPIHSFNQVTALAIHSVRTNITIPMSKHATSLKMAFK